MCGPPCPIPFRSRREKDEFYKRKEAHDLSKRLMKMAIRRNRWLKFRVRLNFMLLALIHLFVPKSL
jgi:hypothetical protein